MSDRLAQARAEAERRYPGGQRRFTQANLQAAFQQGWLAADASPQARTITASAHGQLVESLIGGTVGGAGVLTHLDSLDAEGVVGSILRDLGIEVTDDAD